MKDAERLYAYVESYFARHQQTEWPTVRRIAKSLGWTQMRVQEAIDGDPDGRCFTSSYFVAPDPPFGEHFVESFGS